VCALPSEFFEFSSEFLGLLCPRPYAHTYWKQGALGAAGVMDGLQPGLKPHCLTMSFSFNKLCAWRHNMPPLPVRQTLMNINDVCESATIFPRPCKLTLTLKVVSESHVGYLCANFGLHRPLCYRVIPDVCDRQTSDKSIA